MKNKKIILLLEGSTLSVYCDKKLMIKQSVFAVVSNKKLSTNLF